MFIAVDVPQGGGKTARRLFNLSHVVQIMLHADNSVSLVTDDNRVQPLAEGLWTAARAEALLASLVLKAQEPASGAGDSSAGATAQGSVGPRPRRFPRREEEEE